MIQNVPASPSSSEPQDILQNLADKVATSYLNALISSPELDHLPASTKSLLSQSARSSLTQAIVDEIFANDNTSPSLLPLFSDQILPDASKRTSSSFTFRFLTSQLVSSTDADSVLIQQAQWDIIHRNLSQLTFTSEEVQAFQEIGQKNQQNSLLELKAENDRELSPSDQISRDSIIALGLPSYIIAESPHLSTQQKENTRRLISRTQKRLEKKSQDSSGSFSFLSYSIDPHNSEGLFQTYEEVKRAGLENNLSPMSTLLSQASLQDPVLISFIQQQHSEQLRSLLQQHHQQPEINETSEFQRLLFLNYQLKQTRNGIEKLLLRKAVTTATEAALGVSSGGTSLLITRLVVPLLINRAQSQKNKGEKPTLQKAVIAGVAAGTVVGIINTLKHLLQLFLSRLITTFSGILIGGTVGAVFGPGGILIGGIAGGIAGYHLPSLISSLSTSLGAASGLGITSAASGFFSSLSAISFGAVSTTALVGLTAAGIFTSLTTQNSIFYLPWITTLNQQRLPSPSYISGLCWPTTGHITSTPESHSTVLVNGERRLSLGESAIDIGARLGNPVTTPFSGVIVKVAHFTTGYGKHVKILTTHGILVFAHLSEIYENQGIQVGRQVQANQLLGEVGTTGNSTGFHLHYGVINPLVQIMALTPFYEQNPPNTSIQGYAINPENQCITPDNTESSPTEPVPNDSFPNSE